LFNDEVDTGVIGPMHYRNFIKPYEKELGIFHGRISYWHSCGNTGSIVKEIAKMDYVDVLDISGYTDTEKALSSLNGNISRLDIRLHPLRDLQDASLAWMEDRVRRVVTLCRKYNVPSVSLRVSGLNPWETAEKDFNKRYSGQVFHVDRPDHTGTDKSDSNFIHYFLPISKVIVLLFQIQYHRFQTQFFQALLTGHR
jgi:hypothetical protein